MKLSRFILVILSLGFLSSAWGQDNSISNSALLLAEEMQPYLEHNLSMNDLVALSQSLKTEISSKTTKMALVKKSRFIFCGGIKGALTIGANGAVCFFSNGQKFLLAGLNLGYQFTANTSLQIGLFISPPGASMAGTYYGTTAEFAAVYGGTVSALRSSEGNSIYMAGGLFGVLGGFSGGAIVVYELVGHSIR